MILKRNLEFGVGENPLNKIKLTKSYKILHFILASKHTQCRRTVITTIEQHLLINTIVMTKFKQVHVTPPATRCGVRYKRAGDCRIGAVNTRPVKQEHQPNSSAP